MARARTLGYLGDGPLEVQIAHSLGFARAAEEVIGGQPERFLDLGSGGGVPALVLAERWSEAGAVLLDSSLGRTGFLSREVEALGWPSRVRVVRARAEEAGRDGAVRGCQQLVTTRSFGPPAVVAECAAPFLEVGGILVVSEPPGTAALAPGGQTGRVGDPARWPAGPLMELGLEPLVFLRAEFGFQVLRQHRPCPDRYPRRPGIPAKRPLYR